MTLHVIHCILSSPGTDEQPRYVRPEHVAAWRTSERHLRAGTGHEHRSQVADVQSE